MQPITLPIKELRPALSGLGKIINHRSALAVLRNLRIERDRDGWITLTGTDLDRFVTMRFEQPDQGEPMSLLIPCEDLLKLSKSCGKDESLIIEPAADNLATIKFPLAGGFGESKVTSPPVDELPTAPSIDADPIPLPAELRRSIQEAMECASTDETRYVINGAFIDSDNPKANYIVGTDGRHLYSANSFVLPLKHSVIIPSHKFLLWKEFGADGEWQIKADRKSVQLNSRRWQFVSKQIDGSYPNWRQVVPDAKSDRTIITIDPSAIDSLIQTIGRMPCHDEDRYHTIGLECHTGQLRLLGKSHAEEPWTRVVVPAAKGQGPDIQILCDRRYLLKALGFGLNTIGLASDISPMRFSNAGRQMIVMPLRPTGETTPPASAPPPAAEATTTTTASSATEPTQPQPHPTMQTHTANGQPHPAVANNSQTTVTTTQPATTAKDESKSALETALTQIENLKTTVRESLNGLTKLGDSLRQAMREQKASEKEVQSVRQTLRSLQGVKL